jgi:hypothetical protein
MKKPNMRGWTRGEIQAFEQGRNYERELCLADCEKALTECDNMHSESAVETAINNIIDRAEKEQNP